MTNKRTLFTVGTSVLGLEKIIYLFIHNLGVFVHYNVHNKQEYQ